MEKRIKILHILYELRSSGAEVMIKIAAPYWRENGLDLHVLSTAKVTGAYADKLSSEGIIIHHMPFANSLEFYIQMIKLIRSNHFDVVHIHTERTTLTYALLARLAGARRIIRTLHSTYLFEGLTRFNRAVRRWAVRQLGVIQVSISDSVKQNEQVRFGNPTHLIYNWYDDGHFFPPSLQQRIEARKTLGLSGNEKVIVSVGNCAPVKNHPAIIQALALMKKNGQSPLYWHIGEEDVERRERDLVRKLDLDELVQFWGRQDDVRPFLWAADVFVMPSFREGFGVAMLEAQGSGISVLLARSPGLEQWSAFFPEITYTGTTPHDLAHGLTMALSAPKNYKRMEPTLVGVEFSTIYGAREYLALYSML